SKELKGAQIKIKNGTVATTTDNKATAPTASTEITLIPGTSSQAGAAQDVMTAQSNQGMGTWVDAFGSSTTGDKSISLSIPGISEKVKDAKYTTQLTWLLNDTPA
ncbi:cell surface protein, partial [Bacillus cereus]